MDASTMAVELVREFGVPLGMLILIVWSLAAPLRLGGWLTTRWHALSLERENERVRVDAEKALAVYQQVAAEAQQSRDRMERRLDRMLTAQEGSGP